MGETSLHFSQKQNSTRKNVLDRRSCFSGEFSMWDIDESIRHSFVSVVEKQFLPSYVDSTMMMGETMEGDANNFSGKIENEWKIVVNR